MMRRWLQRILSFRRLEIMTDANHTQLPSHSDGHVCHTMLSVKPGIPKCHHRTILRERASRGRQSVVAPLIILRDV